ncbi:MAG: hypothetical protein PHP97_01910 [Candidatus Shapirobacteria bacterium]|nr:hypothetical protein [Candidatus Shapirobacteria bacterium]
MFNKLLYFFGLGKVTAKCGHQTKVTERIEMVDERGRTIVGKIENTRDPELCIDCLKKKITVSDISKIQQTKTIQ